MSNVGSDVALQAGLHRIHDEAGGVVELVVVRQVDALDLLADAMGGDTKAAGLLQATNQALGRIAAAPRHLPMLCSACPRPLKPGRFAIVLALPAKSGPANAIGLAVCQHCASSVDDIRAKATIGLRRIWPNLRAVTVTHPAGGEA